MPRRAAAAATSRITDRAPDDATEVEVGRARSRCAALPHAGLDLTDGIRPALMFSVLGQNLAPQGNLFTLETEAGTLTSAQVRVTGAERVSPTVATIEWAADTPVPVTGGLTLAWNGPAEIGLSVGVTNAGAQNLRGSLTVTPMPGVVIDEPSENVWTFYPGFGTMISNEPFFEDSVKSDHLPLSLVTAWSPEKGGGLYLAGHDTEPRYDAHYALEKFEGRVTAAAQHLYLDVPARETAAMPEVALGACWETTGRRSRPIAIGCRPGARRRPRIRTGSVGSAPSSGSRRRCRCS